MNEFRQFNGLIGPENLLGLVRNTAPFLFAAPAPATAGSSTLAALGAAPLGWRAIIAAASGFAFAERPTAAQRVDYFALCLACHFATVATFIPTDVDAKIRGVLWSPREDHGALRAMADLALAALAWDVSSISTRLVATPVGTVSGHQGEWLGVVSGALGCFLAIGDDEYAVRLHTAIVAELEREAEALRQVARLRDRELDVLRLATILTHNVGDVDQGLSFWVERLQQHAHFHQLNHLAHENAAPFAGTFQIAAALYKRIMAAEGHRNYPLRTVKALRSSAALLLPIGPFLDEWGRTVASHSALSLDDRAETAAALLAGCKKIPGQVGYYRALAGMDAVDGGLDQLAKRLPGASRGALKDVELRRQLAVKQISFESALRKKAAAVLAEMPRQR